MSLHIPVIGDDFSNLEVAQAFATRGIRVLPTAGNGDAKHAGSVLGKGWPHKTSTDPDQINHWFEGYPDRRVGVHCGVSGLIVFDLDKLEVPLPPLIERAEREHPTATQYTRYSAAVPLQQQRRHLVYGKLDRRIGNGGGSILGSKWGEIRGENGIILVGNRVGGPRRLWQPDGPVSPMPTWLEEVLPNSEDGEITATTAEVAEFHELHHDGSHASWAAGPATSFRRKAAEGDGRHPAMFELCAQATREARCGLYAAKLAHDALLEEWTKARTIGEVRSTPRAWAEEFESMWAYGVAQVATKPIEEVLPRLSAAAREAWFSRNTDPMDLVAADAQPTSPPPATPDSPTPTTTAPVTSVKPALQFQTFAELAAEVDAAGPRRWLIRGIWPAGDYGVHSAAPKAQKTWNTVDLAVSVASGTPWLGHFPVDTAGPVLMFVGEGGKANTVRRIRATAEARGIDANTLPIVICTRAPHLGSDIHMALMADQIAQLRPVLVTLDPLYLATGGANMSSLPEVGAMLERPQIVCQAYDASLWVVHHDRKSKEGTGSERMSGAGPAEWGRVLISAERKSGRTDPDTGGSDVVIALTVKGGEIADQDFRVTRRIWADDPDDLNSPLHLTLTVADATDQGEHSTDQDGHAADPTAGLSPAARKLLDALSIDTPRTSSQLVDAIAAQHGHGLKRQTVSTELNNLHRAGLASFAELDPLGGRFAQKMWVRVEPEPTVSAVSLTRQQAQVADASAVSAPPIGADAARRHGHGDTVTREQGDTVKLALAGDAA